MSGIRFTHIDHCSVIVTDVARSRAFYGGVLGLKEIPAPKEFDFVAIWYDLGGTYLHLLLKPQPDSISPRHFCLLTPDAAASRGHLTRLGVPIEETVKIAAAERFFVRDPDGNRIEILQWVRPYDPTADGRFAV
jgi:catechol 2,3-dioxygenase-like lactoylglutathione lyase family enzyme